jgi:hypothetical protein
MNKKIIKLLPIFVTIFLFAASPLALTGAFAVSSPANHSTIPNLKGPVYPNANGPLVPVSNAGKVNPAGNVPCPSTGNCTVVADGIGGVQVFKDGTTPKLIASVFTPTNSSVTYTCPEGVIKISPTELLVTDPCAYNSNTGLYVGAWEFNPYTLTFGANQFTNIGFEALFGVTVGSNVYVDNFAYGTVTVVTTSDASVTTITTSGPYPEFFAGPDSSGNIYVSSRDCYNSGKSEYADCIDKISTSTNTITATIYTDQTNGIEADGFGYGELTGIALVGHTIVANCAYCDNTTVLAFGGAWFTTTSLSSWSAHNVAVPNSYAVWGSASTSTAAYPISAYNYNQTAGVFSEVGFTFSVKPSHATGSAITLGAIPDFACASGLSGYVGEFPNIFGGTGVAHLSIFSQVKGTTVKNVNYYGAVDGYGCGST